MTIALVIMGLSTAVLAVWCWWLTKQIAATLKLLDDASGIVLKLSKRAKSQSDTLRAVSLRLDSLQNSS